MLPRRRDGRLNWDALEELYLSALYRTTLVFVGVLFLLQLVSSTIKIAGLAARPVEPPEVVSSTSRSPTTGRAAYTTAATKAAEEVIRFATEDTAKLLNQMQVEVSLEADSYFLIGDEARLRLELIIAPVAPTRVRLAVASPSLSIKPSEDRLLDVSEYAHDVSYLALTSVTPGTKRFIATVFDAATGQVLATSEQSIEVRHRPLMFGLTEPSLNRIETLSKIIGLPGLLAVIGTWWFTATRRKRKSRP